MHRGVACFACKWPVAWHNISKQPEQEISTKYQHPSQRSNSFQDSPILSIGLWDDENHVSSHDDINTMSFTTLLPVFYRIYVIIHPTSITSRLCCVCAALQSVSLCFTLQIVQSASLLPGPCKVLNLFFWFQPELVSRWDSNAWLTCCRTVLPVCCPHVRNLQW